MVQAVGENLRLILIMHITECVWQLSASFFILDQLVADWTKASKIVFSIGFIIDISCCKVKPFTLADINLAIRSCLTSSHIVAQSWSSKRSIYIVRLGWNTILSCVLNVTLRFDSGHVLLFEELFLRPFMRYSVLMVVNVITRNLIISTSWCLMRRRYNITSFRAQNSLFSRHIHRVLRLVNCLRKLQFITTQ